MNIHEISKASISSVSEFPNECRNKILKLVFSSYLPIAQDRSKIIDTFSRDINISRETILEVLGVYTVLLEIFLQSSDNEFSEKLIDLGFSPDFLDTLQFLGNREDIIDNLQKNFSADFGKLSSCKWRIDISLSHSVLVKKVPNFVLLSLTMSNGKKYNIELDPQMFHKLRFNITLILNELNSLKSSK